MVHVNKEEGFTIVELMVTLVVFMFVMVAASNIFSSFVGSFKQQSKIAETNIEGAVGLELLRNDIEQAGFGLPWDLGGIAYNEAANDGNTVHDDTAYNDEPSNPPRAFVHGAGDGMNGSDVLVIKATNVAINDNAQRFTYVTNFGDVQEIVSNWPDPEDRFDPGSRVIVVGPVSGGSQRTLISDGTFHTTFPAGITGNFLPPTDTFLTYLIYGINSGAPAPAYPFNRADYYVRVPGSLPTRCAPGTGVLYKATVNHNPNGGGHAEFPILDCVADLQVSFSLDTDNDGAFDATGALNAALTAEDIRNQVKDVRVYILAHEGQFDPDFTFTGYTGLIACGDCMRVGEPQDDRTVAPATGRDFNLQNLAPGDIRYRNYRWKVYTMVLKPFNLR